MNFNETNSKNYYRPLYKNHLDGKEKLLFFRGADGKSTALEVLGLETAINIRLIGVDKYPIAELCETYVECAGLQEDHFYLLLEQVIKLSKGDLVSDGEYLFSKSNNTLNEAKEGKEKRKSYNGTRARIKQLLQDGSEEAIQTAVIKTQESFSELPSSLKDLTPLASNPDKDAFNTRFEQLLPISNYKQSA